MNKAIWCLTFYLLGIVLVLYMGLSAYRVEYIPGYGISIEQTPYNFTIVDNQSLLQEVCNTNMSVVGCTTQDGRIWILNMPNKEQFVVTCNHEVLHNILDFDPNEETWGTSEEHGYIIPIESHTHTTECDALTKRVWG